MIWGPFLLALALGLLVSAGLYFAYLWPQVEPEEPAPVAAPAADPRTAAEQEAAAKAETEAEAKVDEPAPDKPTDEEPQEPPPSAA